MTEFEAVGEGGDDAVLRLRGEIDLASASEALEAARRLVDSGSRTLQIDLSEATFLDSTGVGALVTIRSESEARGCALSLVGPQGGVLRILTLTGMTNVFTIN